MQSANTEQIIAKGGQMHEKHKKRIKILKITAQNYFSNVYVH
jgi:hypothetical protein